MITRYVIILLLCIGSFKGYAKNDGAKVDSLKRVIKEAKHDTTKLNALLAISGAIYLSNPDSDLIICLGPFKEDKVLI